MNSEIATPQQEEAPPLLAMLKQKLTIWARHSFGFDLRSLALLRIAAPSVYLCELLLNWKYLEAFYTDGGMLPRNLIFEGNPGTWSLYLAAGGLNGIRFLYCCQILALACLILGWRTRWASLVCYFFTISLQNRFPALPGWETEIRMLFLIGFFLPWGEWASLDARRKPDAAIFSVSPATVSWRIQIAILYLTSGLLKGGPGWQDGTAVEVSLASDAYATPIGLSLLAHGLHHPHVLVALSFAIPLIEIFTPLFLLCPWPAVQTGWLVILMALHCGFGLCLNIGLFSPICCACLLGFLPGQFWESLRRRLQRQKSESTSWNGRPARRLRLWESVFLAWVTCSIVVSALESLPEFKNIVPPVAKRPWVALGLEQHWGMFVPPPFDGGWHAIKGKTLQGEWVDLLLDTGEATESRPEWVYRLYPGVRGYLYMAAYLRYPDPTSKLIQEAVADYFRRRWESLHPSAQDRISEVEILFFRRQYVPGKGFKESERQLILSHKY